VTEINKTAILPNGGQPGTFTVEGAMQTARGYHYAAGELEAMHQQQTAAIRRGERPQIIIHQTVGRTAGAVVLEALAIEIALKARLTGARVPFADLLKKWERHDHAKLYALLPDNEKQEAEQRYQSHPAMRATLAEALTFSANVFVEWRYMHERTSVEASLGEMQRAFKALAEGM
jgi:hypothetical protein